MTTENRGIGIVGGSGMLGRTIAIALLKAGVVPPDRLWISNRSGLAEGFEAYPALTVTRDNQALSDACDVIVLSVPPAEVPRIGLGAGDSLVVSVMAGVTLAELEAITGTSRVVRAMSSPAAELGLAYSPWCAGPGVTGADRDRVTAIFEACGLTDEVAEERQIDLFTAMTGPVPGFVAFFAEAMADYAVAEGIPPGIADRAIRQLFLSAGRMMAEGAATPADHVRQMIDYAGTTAAGLEAMKRSSIAADIAQGLGAAVEKTRAMR